MAVTDLTGTKWEIKNIYIDTPYDDIIYNINFTSNLENFIKFNLQGHEDGEDWAIYYGNTQVAWYDPYNDYDFGWYSEAYRTISITGGTDVTNATLISWLQSNATQIQDEPANMYFGNLPIADMSFGTRQVKKVYLGNTLVWEKEEPQPTVDPILANNSWDKIKAVCEAGGAADYWSIGDTKTDVGTDGITRTFRIADMQGLYGKHVVFEQVELENTDYRWNPSSNVDAENCYNNYSISQMRTTHLPALLAKYSDSLQGVITNTKYKVATNGNNGTLLELEDKLFLPAEREIFGSRNYSRTEEWNALTRFQLYAANDTSAFRKKFKPGATSATAWWLRSPILGSTDCVCSVNSSGYAGKRYDAISSVGVSPFFSF